MNPESITVSLEWATKLKEAGWDDVCYFRQEEHEGPGLEFPTAEEILRRLPDSPRPHSPMHIFRMIDGTWQIVYDNTEDFVIADTLANAAAQMWIYLKTNHLLPPQA